MRLGVDPYPRTFERTHTVDRARGGARRHDRARNSRAAADHDHDRGADPGDSKLRQGELSRASRTAGRASRSTSGKDSLPERDFAVFKLLDFGDFIGVDGQLFRTKTNELTILRLGLEFLVKCFVPLPEKWHGLSDVEIRYRQRYLDLIVNPDSRRVFEVRSRVLAAIRSFLNARGYLEVETPMMQPIAGGALARPFVTHHNALDMQLFLRIAPELYLKRLVVGGIERVYEINRNFRNEGISTQHNPEFTMLEFYQAYSDYQELMVMTEEMLSRVRARGDRAATRSSSASTRSRLRRRIGACRCAKGARAAASARLGVPVSDADLRRRDDRRVIRAPARHRGAAGLRRRERSRPRSSSG